MTLNPCTNIPTNRANPNHSYQNAGAIPFDDGSFSIVYCQHGLQFFVDKAGALSEIFRVLRPKGQLVVLVWRAIEHSPGFLYLKSALGEHIGEDAAAFMGSPFALGDGEELRALIGSAGFQNVSVQADVGPVRFRSTEDFVKLYVSGTPLADMADMVASAGDDAQAQLISDVKAALAAHEGEDGLMFPIEAHMAIARK